MEESGSISFSLFPDWNMKVLGFNDIQNGPELMGSILGGDFPGAALNPDMIWSNFHIQTSANNTLARHFRDAMKTRSMITEFIYRLSPRRSIKQSLETFGFNENLKSTIVCLFNPTEDDIRQVNNLIQGNSMDYHDLLAENNEDKGQTQRIIEFFEISEKELSLNEDNLLENSIVSCLTFKEVE